MIIGIDTGGTFTDFIVYDNGHLRSHKQLSTPHAPEEAILAGLKALQLTLSDTQKTKIIHGTTVATNAALEGKGVKTAYVTNAGFADVLTLGRQNRDELYNLTPPLKQTPVASELCFELNCRIAGNGERLAAFTSDELTQLKATLIEQGVEAVAINFLFSYLSPEDEIAVQQFLENDFFCSSSHQIAPVQQEYERGMACWLNSWLSPKVKDYIERLSQALAPTPLYIMQSNGGITTADKAANRAIDLLLSGPAGGLAAAKAVADQTGETQLLTFDMGGTSTDVALIDGDISLTQESYLGPYPVVVPMVDMITIGAGGGSLAYCDNAGMLHVGPESAGASPGPACYGQGGTQTTVTDANLVLGRIPKDTLLGGNLPLDASAAEQALEALAHEMQCDRNTAAKGVVSLANEHMIQALRRISIERGHNPEDFTLCCFGGAGGLHICQLAEGLSISKAIVPNYSGLLSALGMVVAPSKQLALKTLLIPAKQCSDQRLQNEAIELRNAIGPVSDEHDKLSLKLRFSGQNHALEIAYTTLDETIKQFTHAYHERYQALPNRTIEVVSLHLQRMGSAISIQPQIETFDHIDLTHNVISRDKLPSKHALNGPVVITDSYATTYVDTGWQVYKDEFGHLRLSKDH